MAMTKDQIKLKIVRCGNMLIERGLCTGTGGNISVRLPKNDGFLITPSGIPYPEITSDDIVAMDFEGNIIEGKRTPSIERSMHRAIFNARSDVNAIVHTHQNFASAIAATRQDFPPILDAFVAVFGGGLKCATYASIGTEDLACNVVEALGNRNGALLANHGVVCTGPDLKTAFGNCEFLEASAITYCFAKVIGRPVVLSQDVVEKEAADLAKRYGQK
jgi:L-fuculose-phosphate aldolase